MASTVAARTLLYLPGSSSSACHTEGHPSQEVFWSLLRVMVDLWTESARATALIRNQSKLYPRLAEPNFAQEAFLQREYSGILSGNVQGNPGKSEHFIQGS